MTDKLEFEDHAMDTGTGLSGSRATLPLNGIGYLLLAATSDSWCQFNSDIFLASRYKFAKLDLVAGYRHMQMEFDTQ